MNTLPAPIALDHLRRITERAGALPDDLKSQLDGPFVSFRDHHWDDARTRTVYVGQETREWTGRFLDDLGQFDEFINDSQRAFADFNFGEGLRHAPFWGAHDWLVSALENGNRSAIPWLNVSKASAPYNDYSDASVRNLNGDHRNALLDYQRGQVSAEICELGPNAVIFVTGPNYDCIIDNEFEGLSREPVDGFNLRKLCRLRHDRLPPNSFRTYHPNYLRRAKLEEPYVKRLVELIRVFKVNDI